METGDEADATFSEMPGNNGKDPKSFVKRLHCKEARRRNILYMEYDMSFSTCELATSLATHILHIFVGCFGGTFRFQILL